MTLEQEIRALNRLSNQSKVKELWEKVNWLNSNNPNNKPVFEIAREKQLI